MAVPLLTSCTANVAGEMTFGGRLLGDEWGNDAVFTGLSMVVAPENSPVAFELGVGGSESTIIFENYNIFEYWVGLLVPWRIKQSNAYYYLGTGMERIDAEREPFAPPNYDDSTLAFYMRTGVYWRFKKSFNLGIEYKYVFDADLNLGGSYDAQGLIAGVTLGWGL